MLFAAADTRPGKFYPQLEGMRAIAIFFVIVAHWWLNTGIFEHWVRWAGLWAINYFYVLSGFLIGTIILRESEQLTANTNSSVGKALGIFYLRRMLRIFPAYYVTVLVLFFIGFPSRSDSVYPWLFTHTSNIYFFLHGWVAPVANFWTLAVEEQFILLLPLIVLFTPRKYIVHGIVCLALLGIATRVALYLRQDTLFYIFTFSSFDALALGVLLGYIKMKGIRIPYAKLLLWLSFGLYFFLPLPPPLYFTGKSLLNMLIPSLAAFNMVLIYFMADIQNNRLVKMFLQNKIILYLGKIGFGLYLYHMMIPYFREYILVRWQISGLPQMALYLLDTVLLLALATVSYYALERPVYSLKKYFKYSFNP